MRQGGRGDNELRTIPPASSSGGGETEGPVENQKLGVIELVATSRVSMKARGFSLDGERRGTSVGRRWVNPGGLRTGRGSVGGFGD